MLRSALSFVIAATFATAASAQTIVINPNKVPMPPAAGAAPIRVSLGMSMFVATPANDSAQSLKAQEDGRKMIYVSAGQECDLLRATIASSCRLESINVNVQRVFGNQNFGSKVDGYNINGNMSYVIAPKEPGAVTP
jgi:hypothetical protein